MHSGINLLAPIYAIYIKRIGGTLIDAGVSIGIYACLKGVLYLILKNLDEAKYSKKKMIVQGYLIMMVGYSFYLFAAKPIHIYGIQVLLSIGETIIMPSWSTIIAISLEKGKERNLYSRFYGYRSLFEGGAAIIGGIFAMKFGFNTVFGLMVLFALTSAILAIFINEKS